MACPLATERVWIEKAKYNDAEKNYFEHLSQLLKGSISNDNKIGQVVAENSENIDNHKLNVAMHEQQQQQQQPTTKSNKKNNKKEKAKQQALAAAAAAAGGVSKQQICDNSTKKIQSETDSLMKQHAVEYTLLSLSRNDTMQKTFVVNTSNAAAGGGVIAATATAIDDESKAKKKKKKKNKSSAENKGNENNTNTNNKTTINDSSTITTTVTSSADASTSIKNQNDEINNDKKNELKRPTNLRSSNKGNSTASGSNQSTLVSEIAKARQHIKNSLEKMDGIAALAASPVGSPGLDVLERFVALEKENANLKEMVEGLVKAHIESEKRLKSLEAKLESLLGNKSSASTCTAPPAVATTSKASAQAAKTSADDDDDDVDLFDSGSEDEDTEAAKIREQRLAEYAAKKSKKPTLIAKSNIILDVKPWDDETDLTKMETEIRKITTDGLLWGASKFVPVAFGIKKLSISCVVEDEKVSIDWLQEEIEKLEDFVQSVDVAAFNKI